MRIRIRRALGPAVTALCLLAAGCSSPGVSEPAGCGVPEAVTPAPAEALPRELFIEGIEVVSVTERKDGLDSVLTVDRGVTSAFAAFKDAFKESDFRVIGEDNEGFEAELYLSERGSNASIQVRRTTCEDLSIVFFRVVDIPES